MTGLLPQGCKTVNEAAAALAIYRAEQSAVCEGHGDYDMAGRFGIRHDKVVQWLAQRNDRRIALVQIDRDRAIQRYFDVLTIISDVNPRLKNYVINVMHEG